MNQVKSSGFTKQMARNMFYGGTVFFILVFVGLIFDSEKKIPQRSNAQEITPAVVRGKHIWETRNCIGCHTLLGEVLTSLPNWAMYTSAVALISSRPGWLPNLLAPRAAARCPSST